MLLICYSIEHPINLSDSYRCYLRRNPRLSRRHPRLLIIANKVTVTQFYELNLFASATLAHPYARLEMLTPVFGITLISLISIG